MAMYNATGQAVLLTWLLLNSQSTVDLILHPRMLLNIRNLQSEDDIRMHYNRGVKVVNRVGDLPVYGTFWYEPTGIANILSIARAMKKFRAIFDSEGRNVSGWSY